MKRGSDSVAPLNLLVVVLVFGLLLLFPWTELWRKPGRAGGGRHKTPAAQTKNRGGLSTLPDGAGGCCRGRECGGSAATLAGRAESARAEKGKCDRRLCL
jgi:hypothetical protein